MKMTLFSQWREYAALLFSLVVFYYMPFKIYIRIIFLQKTFCNDNYIFN